MRSAVCCTGITISFLPIHLTPCRCTSSNNKEHIDLIPHIPYPQLYVLIIRCIIHAGDLETVEKILSTTRLDIVPSQSTNSKSPKRHCISPPRFNPSPVGNLVHRSTLLYDRHHLLYYYHQTIVSVYID